MNTLDAVILGLLQGITEFLPISSSGHLVLGEYFLGLKVETLKSFDILVHAGSLLAIFVYFRKDIYQLILAFFSFFKKSLPATSSDRKEIFLILCASIPAAIIGLLLESQIDAFFRFPKMVAAAMISVSIYFFVSEKFSKNTNDNSNNNLAKNSFLKSFIIGIAQAIAIIPGVSRSGSTISTGMLCGLSRVKAARFSFLIGVPAIAGATLITLLKNPHQLLDSSLLVVNLLGFFSSFIASLLSVNFLMKFLKNHSLNWFSLYLLVMGIAMSFLS